MNKNNNLYLCKYLDEYRVIQLINTIYYNEELGKQLFFDQKTNNLLVRYFKIIGKGKGAYPMLIMQDTPAEYDLSETVTSFKGPEIDINYIKSILGNKLEQQAVFNEKEIEYFEKYTTRSKNPFIKKKR